MGDRRHRRRRGAAGSRRRPGARRGRDGARRPRRGGAALTLAYLALGSNLGDRERRLADARSALKRAGVRILRATPVVETEPFGVTEQPRFLNQVLEVEWEGSARRLLAVAKRVEREAGRRPTYRWGPREIDVDILLLGDLRVDEPDLKIPHPGIGERDFIRRPLGELRPDILDAEL